MSKRIPIVPLSAVDHNQAPLPLTGDDPSKRSPLGLNYMSYEQLDEFGQEMDAIRADILADLGQPDADYIRRVIKIQRGLDVAGRIALMFPVVPPLWAAGVASLGLSKILENMEIGHNVMHGQYDWMNDPQINGLRYEWDNVATAKDWRRTHNHLHHTYTNIHGLDKDIGYGLVRTDSDQPWKRQHRYNLVLAGALMFLFEWGVMMHGTDWHDFLDGKPRTVEGRASATRARKKATRQILKDYVLFPLLSVPLIPVLGPWVPFAVLGGNVAANVIRNVWAFAIIFCGHFPAEVESFAKADAENENRGQWYLRQLLGSANITGSRLFHVMSGNLSHQIEHHLFPDIPARRYPEAAVRVRALCEKYGLNYNTGRLRKQLGSVVGQLAAYAKPPADKALWHQRYGVSAPAREAEHEHELELSA